MRLILVPHLKLTVFLALCVLVCLFIRVMPVEAQIATEPNLKIALIADSANGTNFESVLDLIKSEGAQAVLHQGDFDYSYDADGFFARIDRVLGPNFPYFASVGNHDINSWRSICTDADGCYSNFLKDRMARLGVTPDNPNLDDQMYSVIFQGIKIVFVGQDGVSAGDNTYAPYIENQLRTDDHIWKICSWHKNQNAMQVGGKGNEMGWNVYETCKIMGAVIATGHEHSYHRTKTLTDIEHQTVDSSCSNPNSICVSPGRSIVFVSGLGGNSMRDQERCLPTTYPYGCNQEWAKIYTTNQTDGTEKFGALFITFNVDGDPNKAHGYFKNIDEQIIDEFDVFVTASSVTPAPSPRPSPSPTRSPSPTPVTSLQPSPTTTLCNRTADANNDGQVTVSDFLVWVNNFSRLLTSQNQGEFTCDGKVNSLDFGKFAKQFVRPTPLPTGTSSPSPGENNLITSEVIYNTDSSADISRDRTTMIHLHENLLNATQGWVAVRAKIGFAASDTLTYDPIVWDMTGTGSNPLFLYYDIDTDRFRMASLSPGAVYSDTQTFPLNSYKTIIGTWAAGQVKISIDGGNFKTGTRTGIPIPGYFYIGSSVNQGPDPTHRQPNSDYYWVAAGTGTLTNTDAQTIHDFGNTDKAKTDFPGSPVFIWHANSDSYIK